MKRIAIHILIVLILCGVFCDGHFIISQLSCGRVWLSDSEVYAADGWEAVTQDDLVTAFQYYCKSRNLTIDGSIADALTSFTTTTFNNLCNTLGIEVTSLQANLKKTVEGNLGLRFLMNQQGVLAYNRIFAEFLQNNDLSVGDTVDNEIIYSGSLFTDADGNTCFVYFVDTLGSWIGSNTFTYGTTYKFDGYTYLNSFYPNGINTTNKLLSNTVWNLTANKTVSVNKYFYSNDYAGSYSNLYGVGSAEGLRNNTLIALSRSDNTLIRLGAFCVIMNSNKLYFGEYCRRTNDNNYYFRYISEITDYDDLEDTDITITTNNNTINNNNYTNNYTIIYNDGDYYEDDDEPDPTTPPDGGGGGGDDPDQPGPSGPDLPDWGFPHGTGTIGSDGTFDFDIPFSLPDLNIDWSLKNIGNKFPFCIPSDIVSFYQVLAVEPEAPSIDAHIPLGSFYDWHFVADFSQYDNWARIIRIVEYVGFVITLIYFTVKLVKG